MGTISQRIVVPSLEHILSINRWTIERSGGTFTPPNNLLNEKSLLWVVDVIQHPGVFGFDPYPGLSDKASLLAWTIINNHVFVDGNKRTGMLAMQTFLELNGQFIVAGDEELLHTARSIVRYREHGFSREQLAAWIAQKIGRQVA